MPVVDPELAIHRLNVKLGFKPVIQKGRRSIVQHTEAVVKEDGKWRVCVDFTDLNKVCPKDLFPLPKIDQLVDMTSGMVRMSFLDAYRGYHQIPMHPSDQEKTSFITPKGIFCYQVMPFGLKNVGATFRRMVTKLFGPLIGKTMEVYIDDMVVKSKFQQDHLMHLQEVFDVLKRNDLKLNASKCAFGVSMGKFLGHLVTQKGIEADPAQIKSGRAFQWDDEYEAAFLGFKSYLQKPQLLATPKEGDMLQLYMAVSDHAISVVIIREERKVQYPIYYVSKTMLDAETRYSPLEKLLLALVMASRKLNHYFQAFPVEVVTEYPLKTLLGKANMSGRIAKWSVELTQYDLQFVPRTAIKAQVDGSSRRRGSGARIVLIASEGEVLDMAIRLGFPATNNEAEYEALFQGVQNALRLGAKELVIYSDFQLVVNQLTRLYNARTTTMAAYMGKTEQEHNDHADALATLASVDQLGVKRVIQVQVLERPSIDELLEEIRCAEEQTPSWMDPIVAYLKDDILPKDKKEARKLAVKAALLWLSPDQKLYKKSFSGPYLLCVHPGRVEDLWKDTCISSNHPRLPVAVHAEGCLQYVKKCGKCQKFTPIPHQPAGNLCPLTSPWPFAQWGLDIVAPLSRATGNRRFLITATDYFTKWIEAKPLAAIRHIETRKFIWENIITWFGIPHALNSDNGTQFSSAKFKEFCGGYGINNLYSSGQAEASNKIILDEIKKRLESSKGRWV
ncbi:uncharacterized protein LOC120014175 [Tripterygium wilfordii]|uniref:uncharacterized protein LOC120014175 n=1 Tax=Tripterygium wilfordii TaxID=458696 RepID=UPI0018F83F8B|nr:uncharacterized protein LOC120014175 [Tripterygium wilfordii]